MNDHGFARSLATWARNPSGYSWSQVKPNYTPRSLDDVRNWSHQECRDAGIIGNALDDALDRIDSVLNKMKQGKKDSMSASEPTFYEGYLEGKRRQEEIARRAAELVGERAGNRMNIGGYPDEFKRRRRPASDDPWDFKSKKYKKKAQATNEDDINEVTSHQYVPYGKPRGVASALSGQAIGQYTSRKSKYKYVGPSDDGHHIFQSPEGRHEKFRKTKSSVKWWHLRHRGHDYEPVE
jgi:hypothetical protein